MTGNHVLFYVESRYKINRKRIRKLIEHVLQEQKITSTSEVSIAVVGDRKMRALSRKYKNEDKTRNILSFPIAEGKETVLPPSGTMRLGDIVLSYPVVIQEAARDEVLVDEKVDELIEHGLLHLLGLHHE